MPIHEYKCAACGSVSELLVGIGRNSDDLTCRSCGGNELEKLMSAAAVTVNSTSAAPTQGSTCCGGTPGEQGCVPGSCCGAVG